MRHKYVLGKKRSKFAHRHLMLALVLVLGLGFFGVMTTKPSSPPILRVMPVAPVKAVSTPVVANQPVPEVLNPSKPVRLEIPRLKVDAKIDYLGLTKAGDMAAPNSIADAGWYKLGTKPGNLGSAVIAGHKTGLKGEPGIFTDLGKLQKGDNIRIIDDQNQIINFVVRETRNLDKDDSTTDIFTSTSGTHLNLITCTGSWDAADKSFTKRLVVFADRTLAPAQ